MRWIVLALVVWAPGAWADAVFDRAAGLSRPPAGAREVGQGSGFFVSGNGLLLTAAHLVSACRRIDVVGSGGAAVGVRLLRDDQMADVAVLRVPALRGSAHTPALRLADRAAAADGALRVVGYPDGQGSPVISAASGRNRQALAFDAGNPQAADELILHGDIRHGDSGGPILDDGGTVVGLVRGILPDRADVRATYGLDEPDIAVGPGLAPIRRLLGRLNLVSGWLASATSAVVRVLCWK